jgi:hypothetical protein
MRVMHLISEKTPSWIFESALSRDLHVIVSQGEYERLQLEVNFQLLEDARHVVALRPQRYVEPLYYPFAV